MATITIQNIQFETFNSEASVDAYMLGDVVRSQTWDNASCEERKRANVSAQRFLDRQLYKGTKTVGSQENAFPRTGVVCNGIEIDELTVPSQMGEAHMLLSGLLVQDPTVLDQLSSGKNIKRAKAGGVEVEFFQSTLIPKFNTSTPSAIHDLVKCFLGTGGDSLTVSISAGTGERSYFANCDTHYKKTEGFS